MPTPEKWGERVAKGLCLVGWGLFYGLLLIVTVTVTTTWIQQEAEMDAEMERITVYLPD